MNNNSNILWGRQAQLLKFCILTLLILISQVFMFCGKTETDLDWENQIYGYWIPMGNNYEPIFDMPIYKFDKDSRGMSYMSDIHKADSFGWEIKRAELKIYYDQAPTYYIGYDKYNSRSLFKIESFNDTSFTVIQYFGTGYQKKYYMKKYNNINEDADDWDDTF